MDIIMRQRLLLERIKSATIRVNERNSTQQRLLEHRVHEMKNALTKSHANTNRNMQRLRTEMTRIGLTSSAWDDLPTVLTLNLDDRSSPATDVDQQNEENCPKCLYDQRKNCAIFPCKKTVDTDKYVGLGITPRCPTMPARKTASSNQLNPASARESALSAGVTSRSIRERSRSARENSYFDNPEAYREGLLLNLESKSVRRALRAQTALTSRRERALRESMAAKRCQLEAARPRDWNCNYGEPISQHRRAMVMKQRPLSAIF